MLEVLSIGDEDAARKEVTNQLARKALQTRALRQHGANQNSVGGDVQAHLRPGTGKEDYLLARIKRDNPEVFERVLNGGV